MPLPRPVISKTVEDDTFTVVETGFTRVRRIAQVVEQGRAVRVRILESAGVIELFEVEPNAAGEPARLPYIRMSFEAHEAEAVASALMLAAQKLRAQKVVVEAPLAAEGEA